MWPSLTPGRRVAGLALLLILALLLAGAVGLRWDPFGLTKRRLDRAEAVAVQAQAEAAARQAEVEGERRQQGRIEAHHQAERALGAATAASITQARTADDADIPLDPDRARRLRDHDGELCRLSPGLDGCAAAPDPS